MLNSSSNKLNKDFCSVDLPILFLTKFANIFKRISNSYRTLFASLQLSKPKNSSLQDSILFSLHKVVDRYSFLIG